MKCKISLCEECFEQNFERLSIYITLLKIKWYLIKDIVFFFTVKVHFFHILGQNRLNE